MRDPAVRCTIGGLNMSGANAWADGPAGVSGMQQMFNTVEARVLKRYPQVSGGKLDQIPQFDRDGVSLTGGVRSRSLECSQV